MEFDFFGHEKSWNLKCQIEYEPCYIGLHSGLHSGLPSGLHSGLPSGLHSGLSFN